MTFNRSVNINAAKNLLFAAPRLSFSFYNLYGMPVFEKSICKEFVCEKPICEKPICEKPICEKTVCGSTLGEKSFYEIT
jgi:hypothetical protein